jgi:hypothetical protein
MLTSYLHLVQRSRIVKLFLRPPPPPQYTGCGKGTLRFLECVMSATPEDEMPETMPFVSLIDADRVALEQ